ncbi:MAG: HDOD domain-containing protein [Thermodesulfobacteriota bacterium]
MAKDFLRKIRNLPTLPEVLASILASLDDPRSSVTELEKKIRYDQALTTKLLAVANSAYYGFRHPVTSVGRAVVAVGYNEVRNLAMGLSLVGFLHPSTFRHPDIARRLWLHSVAVCEASRLTARFLGQEDVDLAFTAGLLHDVGKVVLLAFFPDDVTELMGLMARGASLEEAEREMDMSHQAVGKALAEHWELPASVSQVISRHHRPLASPEHQGLVGAVHLADFLAHGLGLGDGYRRDRPALERALLESLNLPPHRLAALAKEIAARRPEVERLYQALLDLPVTEPAASA